MYRLKVKFKKSWRWGINDYTLAEAQARIEELKKVGITAKIHAIGELLK